MFFTVFRGVALLGRGRIPHGDQPLLPMLMKGQIVELKVLTLRLEFILIVGGAADTSQDKAAV